MTISKFLAPQTIAPFKHPKYFFNQSDNKERYPTSTQRIPKDA
ncbi:hypothetical protein EMIT0111MI5_80190 [Burkholderia sp. IT-111MI5]